MAKTYQAPFVQTYNTTIARVITALVNVDINVDATNAVKIYTAGADGAKISEIIMQSLGTSVEGILKIYIKSGTQYEVVAQKAILAIVGSTTVLPFDDSISFVAFPLKATDELYAGVTTTQTNAISITVVGGDY